MLPRLRFSAWYNCGVDTLERLLGASFISIRLRRFSLRTFVQCLVGVFSLHVLLHICFTESKHSEFNTFFFFLFVFLCQCLFGFDTTIGICLYKFGVVSLLGLEWYFFLIKKSKIQDSLSGRVCTGKDLKRWYNKLIMIV